MSKRDKLRERPGAPHPPANPDGFDLAAAIYGPSPAAAVLGLEASPPQYRSLKSLDELLERDNQREKDGFKRKISLGKIVKPSDTGSKKIVVVPTTTEDKLYHDNRVSEDDEEEGDESNPGDSGATTGTAEGEEGDVIGETPLDGAPGEGEGEDAGAGSGAGDEHELGSSAYELGKILTEKFQLPNLKEKGKKKSLTRYVYDLTDRNRGAGQVLDKRCTLTQILKTNIALGRVHPGEPVDPATLLVHPRDYVYRIMSREKDVESQAVVFFLRDYSGSMSGKPTELVCSQHVMIYSWLMYQYKEQVVSRFVLHDDKAREVPDFYTYQNMNVAGGTEIKAAFALVNQIVKDEDLAKDYNIYVFYGGDGDDWQSDEQGFVDELETMFGYINRLGVTIAQSSYVSDSVGTKFERFLKKHDVVNNHKAQARLDVIRQDADDKRLVEGIKTLVS